MHACRAVLPRFLSKQKPFKICEFPTKQVSGGVENEKWPTPNASSLEGRALPVDWTWPGNEAPPSDRFPSQGGVSTQAPLYAPVWCNPNRNSELGLDGHIS